MKLPKKILVIDDSALMRRVISDIINENNDYEVAAIAKDGVEGFDLIISNPNLYSAIILDINMPKMNGVEVLIRIKSDNELKNIPVIMLTTTDNPREIETCYTLGCNMYITKPIDFNKFSETLKRLGLFINIVTI